MTPKIVILESPYAGNIARNTAYARLCMYDSLNRGEAPMVSHLLYTQVLNDEVQVEREIGINAGLAWYSVATANVVYIDYGISQGMLYGIGAAKEANIPIIFRSLFDDAGELEKLKEN